MPLKSIFLSQNQRLQDCLTIDAKHVMTGDSGIHVALIQDALMMIDGADIAASEMERAAYGPSTTAAVLAYKRRNSIINYSYETQADAVVGKMTIAKLDLDMQVLEAPFQLLPGVAGGLLRGLFFSPKIKVKSSKAVIVTEKNPPWLSWARNVKKHFDAIPDTKGLIGVFEIDNSAGVATAAGALRRAAAEAGPMGILIISVGHGGVGTTPDTGIVDLAPNHHFQIGGRGAWLIGQPEPPDTQKIDPRNHPFPSQTSAFYADRPQASPGIAILSELENDKNSHSPMARKRLANWDQYQTICTAFQPLGLIVLLTCKVGGASGFLSRLRQQWGTPILAYKRRVAGQEQSSGRTRIFLEGDQTGQGTNVPTGEFLIPISFPDMTLVF